MSSPPDLETAGTTRIRLGHRGMLVADRYRLDELLGAGGFGEVWRASQEVNGTWVRPVALKLLPAPGESRRVAPSGAGTPHASGGSSGESSWLNEVRAVRDVSASETVATIFDVGISSSPRLAFIAMELLVGETLHARLKRGPIYWRRALAIARSVAEALRLCHAQDVTHNDLKPHNIFLRDTGRVCVLDFGIASLGAEARSSTDGPSRQSDESDSTLAVSVHEMPAPRAGVPTVRIFGTPGYLAPEIVRGATPGPTADAFALGVVLYRMIAGRLPQRLAEPTISRSGSDPSYAVALNHATCEGHFEPLDQVRSDVPAAIVELVHALLHLDPEQRPLDLHDRLERVWRAPYGVPDPPYVGLEAFDHQRAGYIWGRDFDIDGIVTRLRDKPMVILCGPSGCGKSSLAMAGVAPRIDEQMLEDLDGWRTVKIRPSEGDTGLCVTRWTRPPGPDLVGPRVGTVIVVDQLEEVLSLDAEPRAEFCDALRRLAMGAGKVRVQGEPLAAGTKVRVVATIRDDLFGRVAALGELGTLLEDHLYIVRSVDLNCVRDLVEAPARAAGATIERVDEVVREAERVLRQDPGALPLVQFALTWWWEQRDEAANTLRYADWEQMGGIEGALAEAAQSLYDELTPLQQGRAREFCLSLFDLDGRRLQVDEATMLARHRSQDVIDRLISARLVRRRFDVAQRPSLEAVHEALAQTWPPLRRWLHDSRAERELMRDLEYDATRWRSASDPSNIVWAWQNRVDTLESLRASAPDAGNFVDAVMRTNARRRVGRWVRNAALLLVGAVAVAGLVQKLGDPKAELRAAETQLAAHAAQIQQLLAAGKKTAETQRRAASVSTKRRAKLEERILGLNTMLERAEDRADRCESQLFGAIAVVGQSESPSPNDATPPNDPGSTQPPSRTAAPSTVLGSPDEDTP